MSEPAVVTPAPMLAARGVSKHYVLGRGLFGRGGDVLRAVDDVSFEVPAATTVGLVGESGCGKSTLGRVLLQLEAPSSGEIHFDGRVIDADDRGALRRLRSEMQIIFQDPYSSLNPRQTVRSALTEVLKVHGIGTLAERRGRVDALLERVGLSPKMGDRRPAEFSGGQRQRIVIARALAVGPRFIVADEAVSALDVSIRAQILNLLVQLQDDLALTYLFISHDLSVVRHISQRIVVMYLGKVVEEAPTDALFEEPLHPYTQALLRSIPTLEPGSRNAAVAVEGDLPNPIDPPSGCPFHPRCPFAMDVCRVEIPLSRRVGDGRVVACHLHGDGPEEGA